jgi:hypothetical protein
MLNQTQRNNAEAKVVDFNDVDSVGLIFLPQAATTSMMLPSTVENVGLIKGQRRKENTPGDTLFLLTEGLKFSANPGQPNAFCFGYSMTDAAATGLENDKQTCLELTPPPAPVAPNRYLHNFWRGWQAARL